MRSSRTRNAAIVAIAIALIVACGSGGCLSSPPSVTEAGLVPITWVSVWGFDRAAAVVPARLAGQTVSMQLDTGAQTSIGRAELEYLGVEYRIQEPCPGFNGWADACIATVPELGFGTVTRRDFRIVIHGPSLTAASRRELDHQLSEAKTQSTVPLKVGSLGADFFAGQSLYLDLSSSKAGILTNRAAISGATCSFTLLNNRIVLQLTGDVPLTALYDTGASPFAIMVRPATFAGLTGLSLDSASVQHVTVKSWGDEIVVHATDIPLQLRAGDVTLDLQRVHTSELVEQFYQGCGGKADALLGNEAFRGKVLLINFARKTLTVADPLR